MTKGAVAQGKTPWLAASVGLVMLASCFVASHPDRVVDGAGDGAFFNDPTPWGAGISIAKEGQTYSAGSIRLCKKPSDHAVTLQAIHAGAIAGQVHLDSIGVRTALPPAPDGPDDPSKYLVGAIHGVPKRVQDPAGYIVPDSTCQDGKSPVTEIVVTLTKTGPEGGALSGLRVDYTDDVEPHELLINFSFGLCGTGQPATACPAAAGG